MCLQSLISASGHVSMLPKSLALCVPADTCVTVVDASMFLKHLHNAKQLNETELAKGMEEAQESQELICQLMANQIEYADVIALNKTDLLLPDDVKDVNKAVKALNPKAKVIPCTYGCLLYTSPSPRDRQKSRMPSSA